MSVDVLDMNMAGGHAMLLVGYEDDGSMPGGGAFIVRNSWGGNWGEDGYGKIPYAYIELFAMSAATILVPKDEGNASGTADGGNVSVQYFTSSFSDVPEELRPYIRKAERDMKDREGKYRISKGDRVIVDDNAVAEFDTPENRREFFANGKTWKIGGEDKNGIRVCMQKAVFFRVWRGRCHASPAIRWLFRFSEALRRAAFSGPARGRSLLKKSRI